MLLIDLDADEQWRRFEVLQYKSSAINMVNFQDMRTTIDIPEPIYLELKTRAAREGSSIKALILQRVSIGWENPLPQAEVTKLKYPLVASKRPGSMKLGVEGVYEYIPFP